MEVLTLGERRMRRGALLLQLEGLLMLALPAVSLYRGRGLADPRPAIIALLLAPVVWRLGHGIGRGGRGAAMAVTIMFVVRVLFAFMIPGSTNELDMVLMVLELIVLGPAIYAVMYNPLPVDPKWRSEYRAETGLPMLLAIVLAITLPTTPEAARDMNGIFSMMVMFAVLGTLVTLAVRGRMTQQLDAVIQEVLQADRSSLNREVRPLSWWRAFTATPIPDVCAGLSIATVSVAALSWFFNAATQPGAMLVPSVLVIPFTALVGCVVALLWLVSFVARLTNAASAAALRRAALIGTGAFVILGAPYAALLTLIFSSQ